MNNTLIHHNAIADLPNPPPARTCDVPQRGRIGIHIHDRLAWNTVLYANTCIATPVPLRDDGSRTVRVCPPGQHSDSCECPMPVTKPR